MASTRLGASEMEIFGRILEPERSAWDADAARAILTLGFGRGDEDRMKILLAKAKAGELTPEETAEIDTYERVGHLLSLMKSKARQALKRIQPEGVK